MTGQVYFLPGQQNRIDWQDDRKLTDLDFADDIALLAENNQQCQQMTQQLKEESNKIGLRINLGKTKILKLGTQPEQPVLIENTALEEVNNFT